jgi:hypothetical protein
VMDQLAADAQDFDALQDRLVAIWPAIAAPTEAEKTMVAVPSVSMDFPPEIAPLLPAYEERFLFLLLLLAQPRARIVYVTAQPVSPRIVDYYLSLVPGDLDPSEVRRRLAMVSIGDPSPRPLTAKILERPLTIERIRNLMGDPAQAHIVPFATTELEERLAVALGIPMYGASQKVLRHGTKSGSRRIFEEEKVAHPRGASDLFSIDQVVSAIESLAASDGRPREVVLKLNEGIGGFGNAIVNVDGADTSEEIRARVLSLKPIGGEIPDSAQFLEQLANKGGVVEERVSGRDIRSPSVQLRISPRGEVELLSTHDQVLGGPEGQSYFGARFPADSAYARRIADEALKVGRRLAAEGVIGRFAVDFVVVATDTGWRSYAIEINIRKGGTTHPFLTLQLLTNGTYEAESGEFLCRSGAKHYVATDHLEGPRFSTLTSEDLLDLVEKEGLRWDAASETGVIFHMISALPAAGRIGLTAIGNSIEEADQINALAERVLRTAAEGVERPSTD